MPILYASIDEVFGKQESRQPSSLHEYNNHNQAVGYDYFPNNQINNSVNNQINNSANGWNSDMHPQSKQFSESNKRIQESRRFPKPSENSHKDSRLSQNMKASNELNSYYENFENEEKKENSSLQCYDVLDHCSSCTECRAKLLSSWGKAKFTNLANIEGSLNQQPTNTNTNTNMQTNYKDLAILIALGIFIILTLDKIKNRQIPMK